MKDHFKSIEKQHRGHTIRIEWFYDNDCEAPWDHEDGHGPVSDWTTRDKRPGEQTLHTDSRSHLYYDFAEAVKIAKRDGWGLCPENLSNLAGKLGRQPTKGEIAVASVEADFEYLRRWCNNDWFWCGYTVEIDGMDYQDSLWGIDSDSISDFESEAFNSAIAWLENEICESEDSACRDIETVPA